MTVIRTIGVIGAGQMGNGIAHVCALAGFDVVLNDVSPERLEAGIKTIDIIDFAYPDQTHRYWHTHEDTPEHCSAESLGAVGTVLTHVVYKQKK